MIPHHLDFRVLKRIVTIEHVLKAYGHMDQMRRRNRRLVGPCPVHGGDNPTAFVVDQGRWFCFSACRRGGDVVDLVRGIRHLGYREAAEELARLATIAPLPEPTVTSAGPRPRRQFKPYTKRLPLDPNAALLRTKQILPATARRFEAGQWHGPGFLEDCVAVRLHDLDGHPLGYAGRRLCAEASRRYGKWKLPPRFPRNELLFNYHRVAGADRVVVVECPWGTMRLAQIDVPALALLGVSLSHPQRELLVAFGHVVLLLDGDNAGRRACTEIRAALAHQVRVDVIWLPDHCDPDDLDDADLQGLFLS